MGGLKIMRLHFRGSLPSFAVEGGCLKGIFGRVEDQPGLTSGVSFNMFGKPCG